MEKTITTLEHLASRLEILEKQMRGVLEHIARLEEEIGKLRQQAEQMAHVFAEIKTEKEKRTSLLGIFEDRAGDELTEEVFLEAKRGHFSG